MTPRSVESRVRHWLRRQGIDGQVKVTAEQVGARMLIHLTHEDWTTTISLTADDLRYPLRIDKGIQYALAGASRP